MVKGKTHEDGKFDSKPYTPTTLTEDKGDIMIYICIYTFIYIYKSIYICIYVYILYLPEEENSILS
jgi:hypothetical protein